MRKEEFEIRKAELIKEYKHEEALERKKEEALKMKEEAIKRKNESNHSKEQKIYNRGNKELHSIHYENLYIGLDILKNYNYICRNSTTSQLAKRHHLGKIFGL